MVRIHVNYIAQSYGHLFFSLWIWLYFAPIWKLFNICSLEASRLPCLSVGLQLLIHAFACFVAVNYKTNRNRAHSVQQRCVRSHGVWHYGHRWRWKTVFRRVPLCCHFTRHFFSGILSRIDSPISEVCAFFFPLRIRVCADDLNYMVKVKTIEAHAQLRPHPIQSFIFNRYLLWQDQILYIMFEMFDGNGNKFIDHKEFGYLTSAVEELAGSM